MLTEPQKLTVKTYIENDPTLGQLAPSADNAFAIAAALQAEASPAFVVWRTNVSGGEIGNAWIGNDIDGMSSLNMQRLQLLLASSPEGVFDMSRIDRRAGFENPFGSNQNNQSRVNMRAVWKRNASVIEKLLATGTGTTETPATMAFEGSISYHEIGTVMGWSF
jgi:hypothetical protein